MKNLTTPNRFTKAWLFKAVTLFFIASLVACGGNEGSEKADIGVITLTLNGQSSVSLTQGDAYTEAGATATDSVDGSLTVDISGAVNTTAVGEYTLTYSATNSAGSVSEVTRTVTVIAPVVVDTSAPIISLTGMAAISINQGDVYTDAGATAADDIDGDVNVSTSGSVDSAMAGEYTITYSASDAAGNMAQATRLVTVVAPLDTISPVITLNGSAAESINVNEAYVEAGASATDNVDAVVTVVITGSVITSAAGEYTLTYTATDAAGNVASESRVVTVVGAVDITPPMITLAGQAVLTLVQDEPYNEAGASAADNVDASVSVVITGSVDTSTVDEYTLTYTTEDAAGNSATTTRTVNVVPPVHVAVIPFITTWLIATDNESITLPTWEEGYDYTVNWGDGTINTWDDTNNPGTHTYANAGTYTVEITGVFPQIHFDNASADQDKILSVEQWGDTRWRWMGAAFWGCSNLVVNATDAPDLSINERMNGMFRDATSLTGSNIGHWDVSNVNNMANAFGGATSFNGDISAWDTSRVTNMNFMFNNATSFNQDIGSWNVSSVRSMNTLFGGATAFDQDLGDWDMSSARNLQNMFSGVALSTSNYDALLLGWSLLGTLRSGITFSAGNSVYSVESQSIRDYFTNAPLNWTITDGGVVQP